MECYPSVMAKSIEKIRKQLVALTEEQGKALETFLRLIEDPDARPIDIERAQRRQRKLVAEQERLMLELRVADPIRGSGGSTVGSAATRRPLREQVLDALDELGVPAAPRVVSEFAEVRFGVRLPAARFASLRRDEERAFSKDPASRPAWLVPAINATSLTAIPRIVASSSWEDERRVIGARTLRAIHLRTILALLRVGKEAVPPIGGRSDRLDALLTRYAASVPGAIEYDAPFDLGRVEEATRAELRLVEEADREERETAARKLEKMPPRFRLWGRPAPIDGGREMGGVS